MLQESTGHLHSRHVNPHRPRNPCRREEDQTLAAAPGRPEDGFRAELRGDHSSVSQENAKAKTLWAPGVRVSELLLAVADDAAFRGAIDASHVLFTGSEVRIHVDLRPGAIPT